SDECRSVGLRVGAPSRPFAELFPDGEGYLLELWPKRPNRLAAPKVLSLLEARLRGFRPRWKRRRVMTPPWPPKAQFQSLPTRRAALKRQKADRAARHRIAVP